MKMKSLLISMSVAGCFVCFLLWTNSRPPCATNSASHRHAESTAVATIQGLQTEADAVSAVTFARGEQADHVESKLPYVSPDSAKETASLDHSRMASNFVSEVVEAQGQPMHQVKNILGAGDDLITEQQARIIAAEAIGKVAYDRDAVVSVQHEAGLYVVTFPAKQPALQEGERYRGPSYAAQVAIDEKTGKVVQVKVGS